MGEGRIVVGRVNILIEFKNTIRLPADILIASANTLIVFLQNYPSPHCLLCERKDNYCRWRYVPLAFCPAMRVANFPTCPKAPGEGQTYEENVEECAFSQEGVDATSVDFYADIAQRHGERSHARRHGKGGSAAIVVDNDGRFTEVRGESRHGIFPKGDSANGFGGAPREIIGHGAFFSVPAKHTIERADEPLPMLVLLLRVDAHHAHGRLHSHGLRLGV